MPELSRFYNIIIKMIYSDNAQHNKPHFHVYYAEHTAAVGVDGNYDPLSSAYGQPPGLSRGKT